MKRTERHHLKKNEFEVLTLQVLDLFGAKRRELTGAVLVLAVLGLAGAIYWSFHQRTLDKAHTLLADAMVVQESRVGPPADATGAAGMTFPTEHERAQAAVKKYKVAADAYPSTSRPRSLATRNGNRPSRQLGDPA